MSSREMKGAWMNGAQSRLLSAALLVLAAGQAYAGNIRGVVVGVSDGDTVTVLSEGRVQHKVRLLGIDAPEKTQAYGERSKQSLSRMVYMKEVDVEYRKTDRYGRVLGKVSVNGQDANLWQVASGMAWHYARYGKEQGSRDSAAYAEAERLAKAEKVGLWQVKDPTPPWDFRREK